MQVQTDQIDLGPLYEPTPIVFHFETPGWTILFLILATLSIVIVAKILWKYYRNAYRRQALKIIKIIESRFHKEHEAACVNEMMVVLKHVCFTTYAREEVAALSGNAWLEFLESKSKDAVFLKYGKVLSQALYEDKVEHPEEVKQLFMSSKKWIHHHA